MAALGVSLVLILLAPLERRHRRRAGGFSARCSGLELTASDFQSARSRRFAAVCAAHNAQIPAPVAASYYGCSCYSAAA